MIIGASLSVLLLVLLIASKLILLDSFLDIEKNNMEKNVDRALNALQGELSHLSTTNGDYAGWDESYRFIQDGNKEFIEANLPDTIYPQLKINLLIYITNTGKIVYERGFDLSQIKVVPIPDSIREHLSAVSPLVRHVSDKSILTGVLHLPEGLMLVASRPVLTNEYKGPIHGALIMGRYLNTEEIDLLAQKVRLSLTVHRVDETDLPADFILAEQKLSDASPVLISPLGKESVAAYTMVKDIYGKGAFIIKVDTPRTIYRQGVETIRYFILWFFFAGVIFAVVSYLLFEKLVLVRRKRMESEERYRSVVEQASEGILLVSVNNKKIIEGNAAFNNLLGYSSGEVVNMSLYDIIEEGRETIDLEIDRILREKRDMRLRHRDGSYVYAELSANRITYNDQDTMCLVVHDITERKRFEEQLMYQANHDSLTGLANKSLLEDRLRQATAYQKRKNNILAIMLLDLDRFKVINDTLGHPIGDILLQAVAERLKGSVRGYDTVARLGGDEFVIIVTDVTNTHDVITIAKNILNLFTTPFTLNGQELFVTASIGISVYPFDGDSVEHLLMKADTAMYHCKGQGGNSYQFFAEDMNRKVRDRLTLETSLRKAIEQEELLLYYQPKVDLTTGRICGMEALIRWRRADGKLVSPAEFIPLAEETGLIVPIGEWVLRNACRDNRRLLDKGYSGLRVSVNLSGRQFAQENLVEMLKDALTESSLDPGHLELELTESVLMKDEEGIIKKLCAMKETGVMLSIDDFGTGYSSLSYLKRFPIDEVKIDRSFVKDIANNSDGAAIVNAILAMAHTLKLRVVAEGVETMEQAMFLVERRCEEMQGYYFSPPLPLEAFEEMLRSGKQLTVASQHI